jgi:TRAP-type mannitol/chloroaromatic compound transport system permease small subunit
MVVVLFVHGLDFVATSIRINEASDSPLGLPYRWIIKSFVPISMFLLGLAAISRVIRGLSNIFRKSQG